MISGQTRGPKQFQDFSRAWRFRHVTSSPTYPQSNGKVEATVKSIQKLKQPGQALARSWLATCCNTVTPLAVETVCSPFRSCLAYPCRTLYQPTIEHLYQSSNNALPRQMSKTNILGHSLNLITPSPKSMLDLKWQCRMPPPSDGTSTALSQMLNHIESISSGQGMVESSFAITDF